MAISRTPSIRTFLFLILFVCLSISVIAQEDDDEFAFVYPDSAQVAEQTGSAVVTSGVSVGDIGAISIEQVIQDTRINDWRTRDWTGRGIRVGIIDLSFAGFETFQTDFDVTIRTPAEQMIDIGGSPHGVQVLEVIHEIAPQAELYACRYDDLVSFEACVDYMVASRVRIVNHSAGILTIDPASAELWTDIVEDAINDHQILWVNAAGNFARGLIEGQVTPTSVGWHQFQGNGVLSDVMCIPTAEEDLQGRVMLSWGDSQTRGVDANAIDLQLYIQPVTECGPNGERIGQNAIISPQSQAGGVSDLPMDWLDIDMSHPFRISILSRVVRANVDGDEVLYEARGVPFALLVDYGELPLGESAILTPGESRVVLTVGALQDNDVADYSSRGTPAIPYTKPDIVAPGELILSTGQFVGTSAATPIVAASAALIWEAYDNFTVEQLRNFISTEAIIPDPSGTSFAYGNGRFFMPLPPIQTGVDVVDVGIPYFNNFETDGSVEPLRQWSYDGQSWSVTNGTLIGLSNIDRPLIVAGGATPQWTFTDDIMIGFDFKLERNVGFRIVVRQNDDIGYNVIEFLPGNIFVRRDDRGNDRNYIEDRDREQVLLRGAQSANIARDTWYHADIWLNNNYIYIYLDYNLVVQAFDQFEPSLQPGDIILQAMDANRSVSIDNFSVYAIDSISNQFNSVSLPGNWRTSDNQETTIEDEGNDIYLRIRNGTRLETVMDEPLQDMRFSCEFQTSQEDFTFYLREQRDDNGNLVSGLEFASLGGQLSVQRFEDSVVVWDAVSIPFFFTRLWDSFYISLIGNDMEIRRDGVIYYQGTIGNGDISGGGVSIEVSRRGILNIDDCMIVDLTRN